MLAMHPHLQVSCSSALFVLLGSIFCYSALINLAGKSIPGNPRRVRRWWPVTRLRWPATPHLFGSGGKRNSTKVSSRSYPSSSRREWHENWYSVEYVKFLNLKFLLKSWLSLCQGSYFYPAGTGIAINTASVHENPVLYPNPHEFNPDNFAPEAVKKRPQYSFFPFSGGARNCIGMLFRHIFG